MAKLEDLNVSNQPLPKEVDHQNLPNADPLIERMWEWMEDNDRLLPFPTARIH
jgi:hypothetical protein